MLVGLLLIGCATEGESFALAQAEALCAWHARCETLEAAGYDDEADCNEHLGRAVQARKERGELGCEDYDAAAAQACLAVYAEVACDEVPDLSVCDSVCGG